MRLLVCGRSGQADQDASARATGPTSSPPARTIENLERHQAACTGSASRTPRGARTKRPTRTWVANRRSRPRSPALTTGASSCASRSRDFAPKDFEKPEFEKGWFMQRARSISPRPPTPISRRPSSPARRPPPPACGLQVEERWYREQYPDKTKDPAYGAMYRSRLIYPVEGARAAREGHLQGSRATTGPRIA